MLRKLFIVVYSLIIVACGGGSTTSNETEVLPLLNVEKNSTVEVSKLSLKGLEFYDVKLKQVNGSRAYSIGKYDGITSVLTPFSFNFESKDFILSNQNQEVFIDGQRNSLANIDYSIDTEGQLIASINKKNIYSLKLISSQKVKKSRIEAYRSDIDVEGIEYKIQVNYLSNFYMVEKLLTSEVFENLNEFIKKYESEKFMGDYFKGLVFANENKLLELTDGQYSNAGSYEVKNLDNLDILMIYPTNSNYYYAENSCYILSFSRIWQSKCYLKGSREEATYYDKDIYQDLRLYLQEKIETISLRF